MKKFGVIAQVREALSNPVALVVGILLGGFIPLVTYTVSHHEVRSPLTWTLILGGLAYSALTVFEWAKMAFNNTFKALGFVILLEGVMVMSTVEWVRIAALVYLIAINATATGCTLARQDSPVKAKAKPATSNGRERVSGLRRVG